MTHDSYGYPDSSQNTSPYTNGQQIRRVLWWLAEAVLFRCSLHNWYTWRRFVLRLFGAKLATQTYVARTARIEFPWNLHMGKQSSIGRQAWIYNLAPVHIGEYVTISQRVTICTGSHDYQRPSMPQTRDPVDVQDGAWLAMDAFVLPGTTIGRNAVIGARAVVTSDMPENMVCAGHPCKPIKPRLPDSDPET